MSFVVIAFYWTRHHRLSFVFALNRILSGYVGGLPGIHAMWAGADLTWEQPIGRGMEVRSTAQLHQLIEQQTSFAGRAFQQTYHVELFDDDALLCQGNSWCTVWLPTRSGRH